MKILVYLGGTLLLSCRLQKQTLVIQNATQFDSLKVIVSVNESTLFGNFVKKRLSNFDAAVTNFDIELDHYKVNVQVRLFIWQIVSIRSCQI